MSSHLDISKIIDLMRENKKYFYEKFGVSKIGIFGSYAKGVQTEKSDIDIVIKMDKSKKTLHNFLEFKRYIENITSKKVDLATEESLKSHFADSIKDEIYYV